MSNNVAANEQTGDDYYATHGERIPEDQVPVVKDGAAVEDPIDAATANSDEQLARDDTEAIDESNIIDERTRGAGPEGGYTEPGDEEGLPENDGTSAVTQ